MYAGNQSATREVADQQCGALHYTVAFFFFDENFFFGFFSSFSKQNCFWYQKILMNFFLQLNILGKKMLFSKFCQLRRLIVFDQSSPVHPVSESRGGGGVRLCF